MAIYWPSDLPSWWLSGVRYDPQEQTIRTQMDSGVPKVRRRTSQRVVHVSFEVLWTGDDVERFETWFENTLDGGALRFYSRHPITGAQVEYRFRQRPAWSQPPGGAGDRNHGRWRATFAWELLP